MKKRLLLVLAVPALLLTACGGNGGVDVKGTIDNGREITSEEKQAIANVEEAKKRLEEAKKAIKKAFQNQIDGLGYSIIEVVSTCPTNWGLSPKEAINWLRDNMLPYYPLGVYKDVTAEEGGDK